MLKQQIGKNADDEGEDLHFHQLRGRLTLLCGRCVWIEAGSALHIDKQGQRQLRRTLLGVNKIHSWVFVRKANPSVRTANAWWHWFPPTLLGTLICSSFIIMWFPDMKALSFLVHVGFTVSFIVRKMQTLGWPPRESAGLENRGLGSSGTWYRVAFAGQGFRDVTLGLSFVFYCVSVGKLFTSQNLCFLLLQHCSENFLSEYQIFSCQFHSLWRNLTFFSLLESRIPLAD